LAYKLEQEKYIASDLQKTLSKEQEKVSDTQKRLVVEQSAVQDLKSELHECKQENSRLLESLGKVQQEVLQLRYGPKLLCAADPEEILQWSWSVMTGRSYGSLSV
jgi:pericentrin